MPSLSDPARYSSDAEAAPKQVEVSVPADGSALFVSAECAGDVESVAARARAELGRRGIAVFTEFDHAAGARQAGLALRDELVLVFGSPEVGTPLMALAPELGIELPLRLLIWDSGSGTRAGYVDPIAWTRRWPQLTEHPSLVAMRALLSSLLGATAAGDR